MRRRSRDPAPDPGHDRAATDAGARRGRGGALTVRGQHRQPRSSIGNLSGAPVLDDLNRISDPRSPRFQAQRSPALTRRGFFLATAPSELKRISRDFWTIFKNTAPSCVCERAKTSSQLPLDAPPPVGGRGLFSFEPAIVCHRWLCIHRHRPVVAKMRHRWIFAARFQSIKASLVDPDQTPAARKKLPPRLPPEAGFFFPLESAVGLPR